MRNLAPRILLTSGFLFLALGCSSNTPAGPDAPLSGTQSRDDFSSEQMNMVFNIPTPPQPVDQVVAVLEDDVDPYQFAADNGITVIDEMPGTNLA
ncbi:MAG: hypothetical protein HKN21_10355, partial [Candidatus Eisenbacteria bacterium]|nr:hypothetical protein [Candidatus Eisenbacteria bacterium]